MSVADTPAGPTPGRQARDVHGASSDSFDIRPLIDGITAYLGGNANVLMQLGRPAVAYGVLESTVESGQVTRHPLKRQRTTLTYLSVALLGDEDDRIRYRSAVDGSHRTIRSTPDSPVRYNAFDPELQLWVAACLYRGFLDTWTALHGALPEDTLDGLYRYCARLGTTLQMREDLWPADRAAFEEYWHGALAKVSYDERTRDYLMGLTRLTYLPAPVRVLLGRFSWLSTGGFLHPEFREALGFPWSERDERAFRRMLKIIALLHNRLPGPLRRFPFNALLRDMRRRARKGRPLV